jgi:hypothetical protein
VAALCLSAAVLVQAPDAVMGRGIHWVHDLRHHHHPWRHWAAERWASGEVPLWSADAGAGFPLMADGQVGALYPPSILLGLLLPSEFALTASLLLHAVFAALGGLWLGRQLGRSWSASALIGLGFSLSGFLVAHLTYAGMHAVAAWAPWLLGLAWDLSRPRRAALFGLAVAAVLLAGHPQLAVIALLGALVVFLGRVRRRPISLLWAGLGALLGVGIASPQLLATWELVGFSAREGGVDSAFAGMGSLPPWEAINAVLPSFWGWERPADIPLTYVHKGAAYFGTGENHWEDLFYLGLPVVLLAAISLRRRGEWLWKGLAGGAFLLMLGRYTPVYALLRLLPGMDHFRFPVRFSLLLTLACLVLASGVFERLEEERGRLFRWSLVALVLLLGGGLAGLGLLPLVEGPLMGALSDQPERAQAFLDGMRFNGTWGLLLPGSSLAAVAALARWGGRRLKPGLLLVLALDLSATLYGYNPRVEPEAASAPETARLLATSPYRTTVLDRVQPQELDRSLMSASLGLVWGTRDVIVLSPLLLPRHEELLATAGLDVGMEPGEVKVQRLEENLDVARRFALGHVLTTHELGEGFDLLRREGPVNLYGLQQPIRRLRVVPCSEEGGLTELLGADPSRTVIASTSVELPCGLLSSSIELRTDTDELLQAEVELDARGVLVIADTWYPGWEATVDGVQAEVLRVDHDFRGLVLEPGVHQVELRYAPWWRWTLWLSAGLAALLALVALTPMSWFPRVGAGGSP